MKIKIFTLIFVTFITVLAGSALLVYTQLHTIQGVNLKVLEDKLYSENTEILSWSLKAIDIDSLGKNPLPSSWGEIMVVDNKSLVISSSTNAKHAGLIMHKLPELLDQASEIIDAMKNKKSVNVKTDSYMVAVMPLKGNRSLLGFKPRSWEKSLVSEQNSYLSRTIGSTTTILLIYSTVGLGIALCVAFVVSIIVTKPTLKVVSAFEQLSLGNFEAELPRSGGKVFLRLEESFFRLQTSLKMALERLGG
jgi:methyl-accepting chemotaxis protein